MGQQAEKIQLATSAYGAMDFAHQRGDHRGAPLQIGVHLRRAAEELGPLGHELRVEMGRGVLPAHFLEPALHRGLRGADIEPVGPRTGHATVAEAQRKQKVLQGCQADAVFFMMELVRVPHKIHGF